MKITEAIEILSAEVKHPYSAKKLSRPDALKLAIEALNRVRHVRETYQRASYVFLPGETDE